MVEPVLVDTGPLVAMLREADSHHHACVEQARAFSQPMLTCWPVLTEAAWLLRDLRPVVGMLLTGKLRCLDINSDGAKWIDDNASKYATLRPQLADLCLLFLAEQYGIKQVFTLDRRDFAVFRTTAGSPLTLLPETL